MKVTGFIHTETKLDLQPFGNFKFSWAKKKAVSPNVIMIRELVMGDRWNVGDESYNALIKEMKKTKTDVFVNVVHSKNYYYTTVGKPYIISIDHINLRNHESTIR